MVDPLTAGQPDEWLQFWGIRWATVQRTTVDRAPSDGALICPVGGGIALEGAAACPLVRAGPSAW